MVNGTDTVVKWLPSPTSRVGVTLEVLSTTANIDGA